MNHRHLDDAGQQTEEETLDLHVLMPHEDGKADQEQPDQEQRQAAADGLMLLGQRAIQPQAHASDVPM